MGRASDHDPRTRLSWWVDIWRDMLFSGPLVGIAASSGAIGYLIATTTVPAIDCRSPLQREHGQHENRWNGECDARCGVAAEAGAKEAAGGGLA